MERDKMLPILGEAQIEKIVDPGRSYRIGLGRLDREDLLLVATAQQQADRERIKPLVEAAQNLISCSDCGRGACAINLKMALAGLGVEMKP